MSESQDSNRAEIIIFFLKRKKINVGVKQLATVCTETRILYLLFNHVTTWHLRMLMHANDTVDDADSPAVTTSLSPLERPT